MKRPEVPTRTGSASTSKHNVHTGNEGATPEAGSALLHHAVVLRRGGNVPDNKLSSGERELEPSF